MSEDLVFTIAIDRAGTQNYATMARMLISSLLRTGYDGAVAVLSAGGVVTTSHPRVREIAVDVSDGNICRWKARLREVLDPARYRQVLYLDCDCLVVDDVRPLLEGDHELMYVVEYGAPIALTYFNAYLRDDELASERFGVNAGTFAVRGACFASVAEAWERVMDSTPPRPLWQRDSDQSAWNRVILDTQHRAIAVPEGVVAFPFVARRPHPPAVRPRIVHFAGAPPAEQVRSMCERYFATFGVVEAR